MDHPKLTIAIPTRNRAALLVRLVRQCLEQTEPDFEIIVSDNASEDDTLARLAEFSDSRLTVLRQHQNIGMVPNWNACLAAARGDFFVVISDDDLIDPGFVEGAVNTLIAVPDADILIMRARIINELTKEVDENPAPWLCTGIIDFARDILPHWLAFRFTIPLLSIVFRTETLQHGGGFVLNFPYAADAATGFPIAIRGRCAYFSETRAAYLIHSGMATRGYSLDALVDDVIRLTAMVEAEVRAARGGEPDLLKLVMEGVKTYQRKSFGYMMITSARRGLSQCQLFSAWLRYFRQLPGFGLDPLSVGAVLVPRPLIQFVGIPYRKFVAWRQARYAGS